MSTRTINEKSAPKKKQASKATKQPPKKPKKQPPKAKQSAKPKRQSQKPKKQSPKAKKRQQTRRQVYGFFACMRCMLQWESPDTIQRANGKYVGQACSDCKQQISPHKTVALCRSCEDYPCKCKRKTGRAKANRKQRQNSDRPKNGRVYGYYRCSVCRRGWESAYTFVEGGKAKFGQKCKRASCRSNKYHKAHDWKALQKTCPKCEARSDLKEDSCVECGYEFDDDSAHINPLKNHIQALCARCWNRDKPCSARF